MKRSKFLWKEGELTIEEPKYIGTSRESFFVDFLEGGPGSGNIGHAGIPGHQGGSQPTGKSATFHTEVVNGRNVLITDDVLHGFKPVIPHGVGSVVKGSELTTREVSDLPQMEPLRVEDVGTIYSMLKPKYPDLSVKTLSMSPLHPSIVFSVPKDNRSQAASVLNQLRAWQATGQIRGFSEERMGGYIKWNTVFYPHP